MSDLSIYIHIPWCVKKCPYCDFNSHVYSTEQATQPNLPETDYIQALFLDLKQSLALYPDLTQRSIQSVFFGGGTPSLFSGGAIETILNHLAGLFNFKSTAEITLEANPGTVERKHFKSYRQAGINRLSLGIQSFNIAHLNKLGRIHSAQEAEHAIDIAREAGFDNINLDIMYGLIEQSLSEAIEDLTRAFSYQPEHLSWYHLTLEPNTLFYKQRPLIPEEDLIQDIENNGHRLLEEKGYKRYEISAYAQPNRVSQHNLNYWRFGDYLGIGAGAHSKISEDAHLIHRLIKHKHPKTYLACTQNHTSFIQENKLIPDQDKPLEFMMNALRLTEGIELDLFERTTGLSVELIKQNLLQAQALGLLTLEKLTIRPTVKGLCFLNNLVTIFSETS